MIELSIIIPIYNKEDYLKKCLDSILFGLEKKYEEKIEILLIDDGSTDNSYQICENYKKERKFIKSITKKNEGCSSTRNYGIFNSEGKYLWFIDPDDYLKNGAVVEILKSINEFSEDKDVIIFNHNQIREENIIIPKISIQYEKLSELMKDDNIIIPPWNKIYLKELILKNNILFPVDTHMGEDLVFNLKFFYYVKNFVILEEIYYNHLIGIGVTSSLEKQEEIIKSFNEIIFFIKNLENYKYFDEIRTKYLNLIVKNLNWNIIKREDLTFKKKLNIIFLLRKRIVNQKKFFKISNYCDIKYIIMYFVIDIFKLNKILKLKKWYLIKKKNK